MIDYDMASVYANKFLGGDEGADLAEFIQAQKEFIDELKQTQTAQDSAPAVVGVPSVDRLKELINEWLQFAKQLERQHDTIHDNEVDVLKTCAEDLAKLLP